jgi:hypothetical protein
MLLIRLDTIPIVFEINNPLHSTASLDITKSREPSDKKKIRKLV